MPNLPAIDREKAVDDAWTPTDANAIPAASERYQVAWTEEHAPDGTHLVPAPAAAAHFTWDGSKYIRDWSWGIDTNYGGVGQGHKREDVGLVSFELERPMESALHWIATARGEDTTTPMGSMDLYPGKTQTHGAIQLYGKTGAKQDASFLLVVWGRRL